MLLIVMALPSEAMPVVRTFGLKKDMTSHPFPLYRGDEKILVISGVGKVASAMAVTWLQAFEKPSFREGMWVNLGFCGTNDLSTKVGEWVQAVKITDQETGRNFYPDFSSDLNVKLIELQCCSHRITLDQTGSTDVLWCDMESAGFMEAAARFAPADRLLVLKIVSDHLEAGVFEEHQLETWMSRQMPRLQELLEKASVPWSDPADPKCPETVWPLMSQLVIQKQFTSAMAQKLQFAIQQSVASGRDPTPALQEALSIHVQNKKEGKILLDKLIRRLCAPESLPSGLC